MSWLTGKGNKSVDDMLNEVTQHRIYDYQRRIKRLNQHNSGGQYDKEIKHLQREADKERKKLR